MDLVTGVAKDVVTGAVGSLISKLGELLKEEYKQQKSVREKIESLIKELECAHAALRKVGGVPPYELEEHTRIWAREVREVSYDMEEQIDTFLVEVSSKEHPTRQEESFFQRLLDKVSGLISIPSKRRKMAGAINNVYKQLEEVTQRHGRYRVGDSISVARPTSVDPRLAAMYKEVSELVGIEKSCSELTAMLSPLVNNKETEIKMKIVSVVGVGGLGKTTLAKSVYDKLRVDFECSAFVSVGQNPDLKKVFRDILIDIDKSKYMNPKMTMLDEKQIINELRECLGDKRYLLVIDDVWEIESWGTIKLGLLRKNNRSRVITTTRIWKVANEAGQVYKLDHLPYDKSKKLFYTRIFGGEGKCPDKQIDEVSAKILNKCDGVPLAIITMASLLVGKTREKWIEVCTSIAFRDKDNKQVSDTEWILSLSYYDLPPHLKTCLLYLSVFPEDYIISKDSLIWKWIAEGFIQDDKQETWLFEIGNKYFNELLNRSMIQSVESKEDDGLVVGCRVHDMVLNLLRLKSEDENFVTMSSNCVVEVTSPSVRKIRRLTQQNKVLEHTQIDIGHLRSFFGCRCHNGEGFSPWSFKLLHVLALEKCSGSDDRVEYFISLKHVENLLHLRYLGLGYSYIDEIPEGILALKFLQTLDLEGASIYRSSSISLLSQLTQLTCLRAHATDIDTPNTGIEKLTSLQQLEIRASRYRVRQFVTELGKLRELRVLYAKLEMDSVLEVDHSMERNLVESLGNLHKIRHLNLKTVSFANSFLDKTKWDTAVLPRALQCLSVDISGFPSCISPSSLPNLTHLNLRVECMENQHLEILGQLPELRHLRLKITRENNAAKVTVTNTACSADGSFRKLRSLSLPSSSVQFVLNEDSSGVLFILNKNSSFPYTASCSRNKKRKMCTLAPSTLMPNLQVLNFVVYVNSYGSNRICANLGLDCLPSLQRVKVCIIRFYDDDGFFAHAVERQEAACTMALFCGDEVWRREADALRKAIDGHRNRPTLQLETTEEE